MRPLLVSASPTLVIPERPLAEAVAELVQLAQAVLAEDLEGAREAVRAALVLARGQGEAPCRSGGLAAWQARKIAAHIEAGLEGALPVEALAALVGLSASYLSRAFKTTFGEPPRTYVLGRRLARARALIQGGGVPLAEVAQRCGFSDQAHFSRQFRRGHGMSPNRWRRRQWVVDGQALIAA